jgi:anti-sigma factor RsiW
MIDVEALSCQELVELVTDYLEGALDEQHRRAFDAHMADCDGCTEYLDQLRATILIAGTLTPADLSQAAEDALLHAFRTWKSGS